MHWTDERVEMLKQLWSEGLSASQVSTEMGFVSRNAVIGKVHRLKLPSRGRPERQKSKPEKRIFKPNAGITSHVAIPEQVEVSKRVVSTPDHERGEPPDPEADIPSSRHLTLFQLKEDTCKWPNGDPLTEDFDFCGNDTNYQGPYCAYHSRLAYQPAVERRRHR